MKQILIVGLGKSTVADAIAKSLEERDVARMKPEEAISVIMNSTIIKNRSNGKTIIKDALGSAIEALEKQTAKKPTLEADGYDDKGELLYGTWFCPHCIAEYEIDYHYHKHCPECGQKIDWSEE